MTTMVPTPGVERIFYELRVSLADNGTNVFVDGSVEVPCALGSIRRTNELVQFVKCCYEAEDEGGQVAAVAVLVLGLAGVVDALVRWIWKSNYGANRGRRSVDATLAVEETLPTPGPRHEVDVCSIGAIRQKRAKTITSFVKAHRGGSSFAGFADSSCRNVMVEVVATSVAWSRRVFAGSETRRICISADEFYRESSRMTLICRDLCFDVLGYLPLQVMPHRVEKRVIVFLSFAPFFSIICSFFHFFIKTPK